MISLKKLEERIRKQMNFSAGSRLRSEMLSDVLLRQGESTKTGSAQHWPIIRRITMRRLIGKLASAAAVIAIVVLSVGVWQKLSSPAYALEQTIEALKSVKFMHIVKHDRAGNIEDERWEEVDTNGYQARYRQNTPSHSFYVIDDRETVMVYHEDKNTAILYDPNQQSYTWHYAPGKMFDEIAEGENYILVAENVQYKGRPAHHLRTANGDTDVYIDPETKLPIASGDYEFDYGDPPDGTFDVVIPEGVFLVDKRPGAEPGPEPEWMIEERRKEELGNIAQGYFEEARLAMGAGDYAKAIEMFSKTLEISQKRNWASLWLGVAFYEAGDYDASIYELTKVIDMLDEIGWSIPSYFLARGKAYHAKGMTDMAKLDVKKALPKMVLALRKTDVASSFDLADDPLILADGMREGCHDGPTPEQSIALMINRLRSITGQDFGYDPSASQEENEAAIVAWERWLEDDGQINFAPEAGFVPVPSAP